MQNTLFLPVHKLNGWLWRRGFDIPAIRRMMLWQCIFAIASLLVGCVLLPWTQVPLAFTAGLCIFLNIFWGIARHIMRLSLTAYSMALFAGFLLRMGLRMAITAVVLYILLVTLKASPLALVSGVAVSTAVALGAFAYNNFMGKGQR